MQSTQAQMRKRERKRLKREEKRRSLQTADARRSGSLTRPDLSDSFKEFVRPLIERIPPYFRLEELRRALVLVSAVWNAVITAKGDVDRAVADVSETTAELQQQPVSPRLRTVFEALAARKSTSFGDDDRLVADLEVHRQGADVRVVARARAPPGNDAAVLND